METEFKTAEIYNSNIGHNLASLHSFLTEKIELLSPVSFLQGFKNWFKFREWLHDDLYPVAATRIVFHKAIARSTEGTLSKWSGHMPGWEVSSTPDSQYVAKRESMLH